MGKKNVPIGRDTRGGSLLEYIIILGLVALLAVAGFRSFGQRALAKAEQDASCVASLNPNCASATGNALSPPPRSSPTAPPRPSPAPTPPPVQNAAASLRSNPSAPNANRGVWYWTKGIAKGIALQAVDDVKGLAELAWYSMPPYLAYWGVRDAWNQYNGRPPSMPPLAETVISFAKLGLSMSPAGRVVAGLGGPDPAGDAAKALWSTVKQSWRRDPAETVGRGLLEVGLIVVPWAKAKWAADATKLSDLAKAGELEKAVEATNDATKTADTAETLRDADQTATAAKVDDATALVTKSVMDEYGLTPDTELYRTMDPKYLDPATNTVAGNSKSMARVVDPYNPIDNPMEKAMRDAGYPPNSVPAKLAPELNASKLGPGLNVAVSNPASYAKDGSVTIAIKVQDVLDAGGRIYPDVGSNAQNIKPLFVTFNGKIPYRLVPP